MEAVQTRRSRTAAAILLGLILFPLCAVPLYTIGHIADDFDANGGFFALGQLLGVLGPAVAASVMAHYWAGWRWLPAAFLGIACWFVCGAVLMVTFVALGS